MDIKNYTNNELREQLGLIELHVKQYGVDENFCLGCIKKHLDNISGLSKEGSSLKGNGVKTYKGLTHWVENVRTGKFNGVQEIAEKARSFRKKLGGEVTDTQTPNEPRIKKHYDKEFFMKTAKKRW